MVIQVNRSVFGISGLEKSTDKNLLDLRSILSLCWCAVVWLYDGYTFMWLGKTAWLKYSFEKLGVSLPDLVPKSLSKLLKEQNWCKDKISCFDNKIKGCFRNENTLLHV